MSKSGNISRRQQLQGSEDSLGRQQGAEDAEWPSLTRAEGTRQPWLATSLEEGKLRKETRLRQGPSPDLPAKGKPKEIRVHGQPLISPATEGGEQWPMPRRQRTVAHAACASHKTYCSLT